MEPVDDEAVPEKAEKGRPATMPRWTVKEEDKLRAAVAARSSEACPSISIFNAIAQDRTFGSRAGNALRQHFMRMPATPTLVVTAPVMGRCTAACAMVPL